MLKKTMLLFFMPLLIKCLIKIVLKIYMLSGRCSISIAVQVVFFKRKIETTEATNEFADDFGFSVAGVDFILHSRRYAYVAGVRHLRDETTTIRFPSPSLKTRPVWTAGR